MQWGKNKFYIYLLILIFTGGFLLSCGAASSSSDSEPSADAATTTETTNTEATTSTTPSAKLTMQVVVSPSDAAKVQNSTTASGKIVQGKKATPHMFDISSKLTNITDVNLPDGQCNLFKLNESGTPLFDHNTSDITDGLCVFESVTPNVVYLVEAVKKGLDNQGKANELKQSNIVRVTSEKDEYSVPITPKTGHIANMIIETAYDTISSFSLTDTQVDELVNSITTALNTLIDTGAIILASNVAEIDPTQLTTQSDTVTYEIDEEDRQITTALSTDTNLVEATKEIEVQANLNRDITELTFDEAKRFIKDLMNVETQQRSRQDNRSVNDENDIPDFIIRGITESFIAGKKITIKQIVDAFTQIDSLASVLSSVAKETIENYVITDIFKPDLQALQTYDNSVGQNISREGLSKFDDLGAVNGILHKEKVDSFLAEGGLTSETEFSVPEFIVLSEVIGLFEDDFVSRILPEDLTSIATGVLLNDEDMINFVENLGLIDENLTTDHDYNDIQIDYFDVYPAKRFLETSAGNWEEKPVLQAYVGFSYGHLDHPITKVLLQYNNNGVTQSVEMVAENYMETMPASEMSSFKRNFKLARQFSIDDHYQYYHYYLPSQDDQLITAFSSGDISLLIYSNDTLLNQETKKITLFELSLESKGLLFPKGEDPIEIAKNGRDPNFEMSQIPLDDTNTTRIIANWRGLTDADKLKVKQLSESEGSKIDLVYILDLSVSVFASAGQVLDDAELNTFLNLLTDEIVLDRSQDLNSGWDWDGVHDKWKHLWSTWDNQLSPFIRGTKFEIPIDLIKLDLATGIVSYELEVRPMLVNLKTEEILWEGHGFRSRFKVGESQPWEATLKGSVTFPNKDKSYFKESYDAYDGTWKLGLFLMHGPSPSGVFEDVFWSSFTTVPRSPVHNTAKTMMTSLLTNDAILSSTTQTNTVSFILPSILKNDQLLTRHAWYELILWYDNDDSGSVDKLDVEIVNNTVYQYDYLNFTERHMSCGGLRLDDIGVTYHSFMQNETAGYETVLTQETDYSIHCDPFYYEEMYQDYYEDEYNDHNADDLVLPVEFTPSPSAGVALMDVPEWLKGTYFIENLEGIISIQDNFLTIIGQDNGEFLFLDFLDSARSFLEGDELIELLFERSDTSYSIHVVSNTISEKYIDFQREENSIFIHVGSNNNNDISYAKHLLTLINANTELTCIELALQNTDITDLTCLGDIFNTFMSSTEVDSSQIFPEFIQGNWIHIAEDENNILSVNPSSLNFTNPDENGLIQSTNLYQGILYEFGEDAFNSMQYLHFVTADNKQVFQLVIDYQNQSIVIAELIQSSDSTLIWKNPNFYYDNGSLNRVEYQTNTFVKLDNDGDNACISDFILTQSQTSCVQDLFELSDSSNESLQNPSSTGTVLSNAEPIQFNFPDWLLGNYIGEEDIVVVSKNNIYIFEFNNDSFETVSAQSFFQEMNNVYGVTENNTTYKIKVTNMMGESQEFARITAISDTGFLWEEDEDLDSVFDRSERYKKASNEQNNCIDDYVNGSVDQTCMEEILNGIIIDVVFTTSGNNYLVSVNGVFLAGTNPQIPLDLGKTYQFDYSALSHPVVLFNDLTSFESPLATIQQNQTYSLVPTGVNMAGLKYRCQYHSSMANSFVEKD